MIATKPIEIRSNLKKYMDIAYDGEPVIVSRKQNRNVVILSEKEYNEMQKSIKNSRYLKMLEESARQFQNGEVVHKTMADLEKMENE